MLKVNAHMAIKAIAMLLLQFFVLNCFAAQIHQKDLSTLNAQAEKLVNSSPDKAILILKEVLKEMDASGDRPLKAKVLKNLGNAQYHLSNYRQSLEYYEQALKIYRELEDQEGIASMLNNSGLLFELRGDYSLALQRYNEASAIFAKTGNDKKLSGSLSNTGNIYYSLGRFDRALDFLSQSLKISEKSGDTTSMAAAYNNIGNLYSSLKDEKMALIFYKKAEKIHAKTNDQEKLSLVYSNLSESYLILNKIDKALKYNQLSLEIASKNHDKPGVITSLINISNIYIQVGEYNSAEADLNEALRLSNLIPDKYTHACIHEAIGRLNISQKEYDEAISSYKEALALLGKSGPDLMIKDIYSGLSRAWEAKGNYARAFEYLQKHNTIFDSVYNRESMNRLNMARASFELEQAERDNQLLKQQNIYSQLALNRQQTIRNLLIFISAIVIIFLVFISLMYISKKKKNILLAERNLQISAQKEELDKLYLEQYKLNETKNKFFSIIAHDLKSPFQSLLGFSELLSQEYKLFTDEQRLDAINNMYKVTKDTYKLIENLLEWGRIQTGTAVATFKSVNLHDSTESIVSLIEIPLKNKGLQVISEIPPMLLANGDPNMLSAVIRNLLSNAVKFSNPGGKIYISGSLKKESVNLSIIDQGIGIAPDVINKLFTFDPKVRRNGTKGETGTGMGLGLCMEFMQLNGGTIKVESKYGEGSTFTMIMQPASYVHQQASVSNG